MKKLVFAALALSTSLLAHAETGITQYEIPYGNRIQTGPIDGNVIVDLATSRPDSKIVTKSFFGADSHSFSNLPSPALVNPLQLGYVKFGGSLFSVYNWKLHAYYDRGENGIFYASPLEEELKYVQRNYQTEPMFQINMLGWQPDLQADGKLGMLNTANAQHAANAITYINGQRQVGVKNIIMGNEPFLSKDVHNIDSPSADEYISKYIDYAVAVRAAQEKISGNPNDIKLWGPEIATGWTGFQTNHPKDCIVNYDLPEKIQCSYGNGTFSEFMPYFLSRLAAFEKDERANPKHYKLLDYVSFHYYPLFRTNFHDVGSIIANPSGKQNVSGMLEAVNLWDSENYINAYDSASPKGIAPKLIKKFHKWISQNYPAAKLAVTEYGVDSMDNIAYHPIVRPLYLADLMPRLGQSGVDTFINSFLQSGATRSSWSMINGDDTTRLYQIYYLYSTNFLGNVLASSDNYGDAVNSYSVKGPSSTNVFLVNKDTKGHNTTLNLVGADGINTAAEVALPAWSLTVLKIPDARDHKIQVMQYGAKEMGIAVENL